MSVRERDPHTGYLTTGHEWNGIKELNTPVPRVVYACLAATAVFAVLFWVLMPAWPIGSDFTRGILGIDQRRSVQEDLRNAALERSSWSARLEAESVAAIQADRHLMQAVRQTGRRLFGDNCAACHGAAAQGGRGYPNLRGASWLWGGSPETLAETIRVGINSTHPESRVSQMMAFGRNQLLLRREVDSVVDYVLTLSRPTALPAGDSTKIGEGRAVFAENCAACHGDAGTGSMEIGAPDLTDGFWIYGGDRASILATLWNGRQGHMPSWEGRLSALERRILALYLADLRSAGP